jgi:hypothetical protein
MIAPGTFVCYQGTLGAGKTLSMTRAGAAAFAAGQRIYANYDTVFAEPIESIKHLFQLRDAVLMLDELQSILDSREFKNNAGITQWILIVRKLGLSILYTTQFLGQVDLRVRHVTEYVYCCEKASLYGFPATKQTVVKWRGEGGQVIRTSVFAHSPQLYALYDTRDYRVRLTKNGREASFNADAVLGAA